MTKQEEFYQLKSCACCETNGPFPEGQPCVACKGVCLVMVPDPASKCSQCWGSGFRTESDPVYGWICNSCWGSGWTGAVWLTPTE